MYSTFEELEGELTTHFKTKEAKNLIKDIIKLCKREKKTINETFTKINQVIVGNMGTC
jgi:hypothetical protein